MEQIFHKAKDHHHSIMVFCDPYQTNGDFFYEDLSQITYNYLD